MKIAIVHDWLVTYAGAERVLEQLLKLFPEADVYTVVDYLPEKDRGFLQGRPVHTSFIQKLPLARKHYRNYLALMPLAIEQFDLSSYDLIVSSSHAVAKGVIVGSRQVHVSYVHTPIRYAWELQHQYLRESNLTRGAKAMVIKAMLSRMRMWDSRTANGVDYFVANSRYIADRIWRVYRREAEVIYPPVDVDAFELETDKGDYYMTASRMVPYKKIDLIVEAFAEMPDKKLIVIGDGPDFKKIKSKAGPNVVLLGYQPFHVLKRYMQKARAFVFAAEEDFGIAVVEAQACGTPVIAFGKGGAVETVRGLSEDRPTGVFFREQSAPAIRDAVRTFELREMDIMPVHCRRQAEQFSREVFLNRMGDLVEQVKAGHRVGELVRA